MDHMTTAKAKSTVPAKANVLPATNAAEPLPAPAGRVAKIAALLTESGPRNEALGRLTPDVVDALHGQALYRMLLPKAYGGQEVSPVEFFHAMVALATCDASTAWCVGQQNGCAMSAAYMEPSTAARIWSNDPRAALAWGPPMSSEAIATEGGHKVTGKWSFGSGCRQATWIGLQCNVPGAAIGITRSAGGTASQTFIVPAHDVAFEATWDTMGLRATSSDSWTVKDHFVPDAFAVRRDTALDRRIKSPLYHLPSMSLFAIGFSGVAIGASRALLDSFVGLARGKTQRGVAISLKDNHAVQAQVAEAEARLRSAVILVSSTVERVWQEVVAADELTPHQRLDLRLATTHALHEAKTSADIAWDAAISSAAFATFTPSRSKSRDVARTCRRLAPTCSATSPT
jgi:indole-3-acetate monooxygenase